MKLQRVKMTVEIVMLAREGSKSDADSAFSEAFYDGGAGPRRYEFSPVNCGDDLPDGWGLGSLPYRFDGGDEETIGHILHGDEQHCNCGYPLQMKGRDGEEREFVGWVYHISLDPVYHAAMRLEDGRRIPFVCQRGEAIDFMRGKDRRPVRASLRVVGGEWSLVSMVWATEQ